MQYLVSASHSSNVIGAPSSLLKEAFVETHAARLESMDANKSFVVVLPLDPVIPMTVRLGNCFRTYAARDLTAVSTSETTTPFPFTSRVVKRPVAP